MFYFRNHISRIEVWHRKRGRKSKQHKNLILFFNRRNRFTIFHSLDLFAKEKARLRKLGAPIDDFDLLIGATSIQHNLTMVTNNTKHFKRINGIV